MLAVVVNAVAILVGSLIGIFFKKHVSRGISPILEMGLGFCTLAIGVKMSLRFEYILVVIGCIVLGGIIGHATRLEDRIQSLGSFVQNKARGRGGAGFVTGFTTTTIVFCVGSMAIIGGIEAGISENYEVYFAKSLLDGVFAMSFASVYGVGVMFSALSVLIYQGAITLAAPLIQGLDTPRILNELSGVGGILNLMIGVSLSGIKKVPVGTYLPAIFLAMAFCLLFGQRLYS